MKLGPLLLTLFAPFPFWALGVPWSISSDKTSLRLAPLIGCALAGLCVEFALIAGLPVLGTVAVLTALSTMVALLKTRGSARALGSAVLEWTPLYLVAVLAASLSPFPVLGNWDGDWLLLYQMGQAVIHTGLQSDMLARPPLFGAAAAPLWLFSDGLIPYQIMAAIASAAAAAALLAFIARFWPRSPRAVLLPLLLSPFFLHHTAAAWSKLLCAGLVVAAISEGLSARRLASAALFALSVAVHEGAIIWGPCLVVANLKGDWNWRGLVRATWPLTALGLLVVAPFQVWVLVRFGLAAKVAASPVMEDVTHQPFFLKTVLAVVTSFVAWGPAANLYRWLHNPHPAAAAVVGKEAFWLLTSWITTLAGTLVGLLFPFLLAGRSLRSARFPQELVNRPMLLAIGTAVLLNALLTPFYGYDGTMQNGLVPLALGGYGLLAGTIGDAAGEIQTADGLARSQFHRLSRVMLLLGTLPWLLLNVGTSLGLWLSAGFRDRIKTGSEGDYFRLVSHGLDSLGMAAFPQVPILCLLLLGAWFAFDRAAPGGNHSVTQTISGVTPSPTSAPR